MMKLHVASSTQVGIALLDVAFKGRSGPSVVAARLRERVIGL